MNFVMALPTEDPIPTRYSLLSRLQDWGDQDSWKDFFDTYWRLIYSVALKSGLKDSEAQDVVQETVISVFKSMPDFQYKAVGGSFKTWLLQLTAWRIGDQYRSRQRQIQRAKRRSDSTARTATTDRVKRAVDPKQFQIFDLYVLKNWPARKVASTLRVSLGRVYLAKHRIGAMIKKEIKHLHTKPI